MTDVYESPLLVHLGFPKALSSWLQKKWFVPECGFQTVLDPVQVQLKLIDPSPFNFSPAAALAQLQSALPAEGSGLVPVVTSEALAGNMYSGGYNGKECFDRVLELAPQARFLLLVREQKSLIRSLYKSLITWGMPHTLERLLNPVEPRLAPQFNLDFMRFDQRVAYYQQQVGADRVLVLPYERFAEDPQGLLRSIHEFAGVAERWAKATESVRTGQRVNAGQTLANLYLERWRNALMVSGPFNYSGLRIPGDAAWQQRIARSKRSRLPAFTDNWFEASFAERVRAATAGQFAASNQRLQQLTGLELGAYGYEL